MPIKDIICPICTEVFITSDDIYTTSCGHLFHSSCLNDWKRRELSCPQCRHNNPTDYKLFLTFDESDEDSERQRAIQLQLDSSNEKITTLLVKVRQAEDNFLTLQNEYTTVDKSKRELDERIQQMEYSERNFCKLQEQYRVTSEHAQQLQARAQQLFIENERISKDLRLKKMEKEYPISSLKTGPSTLSDSSLREKIKILEQRVKHVSEELGKEINISTQLSIDTMRLQSSINNLNSVKKTEKAVPKQNDIIAKSLQSYKTIEKENTNEKERNANRQHDEAPNSVFIKDLPREQLTIPIENVIVNLGSKMNLSISPDDLIKVNFLDDPKVKSSKVHLCAEFKSSDLRSKFLSKRSVVKNDPATESIYIAPKYVDDHLLFLYATEKLRNNGFDHFFCKNGKIFAKKNKNHPKVVLIHSETQVDNLLTNNKFARKSSDSEKLRSISKLSATSSDPQKSQTVSQIPAKSSDQVELSNDKTVD